MANLNPQPSIFVYFGLNFFVWGEASEHVKGNKIELDQMAANFKPYIEKDLKDMRRGSFVPKSSWSISGSFKHVNDTNIWLYQHSSYATCSSVKFSNFSNVLDIEHRKAEYPLCPYKDHDNFKVYFEDNLCLMQYLEHTCKLNPEEQAKLQMLQRLKHAFQVRDASNTPFETPGLPDQRGIQFDENAWSKRLARALQELLLEFGMTVTFTGKEGLQFDTFQSKRSTLPCTSVVVSSYLFHGAPDILIDDNPIVSVEMEEETEEGHYVNGNHVIDCGKQAMGLICEFPEKLGELVANMYIANVQRVMKSLKEERIGQRNIETRGLFLHKAVCGLTCSLVIPMFEVGAKELPQESSKIIIDELYSKSLPCAILFRNCLIYNSIRSTEEKPLLIIIPFPIISFPIMT